MPLKNFLSQTVDSDMVLAGPGDDSDMRQTFV